MRPYFEMSIGRQKMSDEASLTSGASPTSGSACHWVPSIVLFDVMCTYAAPGGERQLGLRRDAA